jgi:hypothetical protein
VPQLQAEPTIHEQLDRLEDDLRRLKVEFDIFFAGGSKRPPLETRNRVETVIRRMGDDRSLRYEQRYRFNGLSHRYNIFRDLWRRLMQQREEGRWQSGYFGGSKAAIEEEAAKLLAETTKPKQNAPPPAPAAPSAPAASPSPSGITFSDPAKEQEKVRQLFEIIVQTKKIAGEPTDRISFTQFSKMISSRTEQVKQAGNCKEVTYQVSVENGSVKFTAKGKRS